MSKSSLAQNPTRDPISALAESSEDGVLAIITNVEGPSYRPLGASMAIFEDGHRVGSLSSGCIESDIVLHAAAALKQGKPATVLYGQGSPFVDIKLPCGGGLEILLVPRLERDVLEALHAHHKNRAACTLVVNRETGDAYIERKGETGLKGAWFYLRIEPEVFFYVFGKGPEASTFAGLVQSAGFPNLLLSPDEETREFGQVSGCRTVHLKQAEFPADIKPDRWSAIVLFFHDHEWEPPILKAALDSPAFYIGAQGSQRARDVRDAELLLLGADQSDLDRLIGPIGLVASARDARTLAVSVMAEVLSLAKGG